jgi:hypothetical protein
VQIADLRGQRSGRLVAIEPTSRRDKYGNVIWLCTCDCGRSHLVVQNAFRRGNTRSCRCIRREREHGYRAKTSPEYRSWKAMRERCNNPKAPKFKNWGGRGITVCERWNDFRNFLADMGPRPSLTHSIDRKDNDGNYEPGNCRWATAREQTHNRRRAHKVEEAERCGSN